MRFVLALTLSLLTAPVFAGSDFLFDEDDYLLPKPIKEQTKEVNIPLPQRRPPYVKPTPPQKSSGIEPAKLESSDEATEAGINVRCPGPGCNTIRRPQTPDKLPVDASECYGKHLLASAKARVKSAYGNRDHSRRMCAQGVRLHLEKAKMKKATGGGPDAIDYHASGLLKNLGFKDIYQPGMKPDQAPTGAVLVFSGPNTEAYLARGSRRNKRISAGNEVGHITIKGDDGRYYTDGRTRQPAIPRRYLAAVYVMETCKVCPQSLKDKCEGGSR